MKRNPYRFIQVSHPSTGERLSLNEHVYIWLLANGLWQAGRVVPPDGCVIHHKDFNPRNNDISNLECLTYSEHNQLHWDHAHAGRAAKVSKGLKRSYSVSTHEERSKRSEKGRAAAAEKRKQEGMTPAQRAGWEKARAAAYGGTRVSAKPISSDDVAEIKRLYFEVKGKHGKVLALAERFGISRRRLCRIALT